MYRILYDGSANYRGKHTKNHNTNGRGTGRRMNTECRRGVNPVSSLQWN